MLVHKINFKVHGVTFDNEDNIDIQDGIVKILKQYKSNNYCGPLYNGYTKKEILEMGLNVSEYEGCSFTGSLKESIFENRKCYKIYIDTFDDSKFHIGYAPKNLVNEISEWINKEDLRCITNITITGGKCKHCVSKSLYYEDIETVEIIELAYGFNVELRFCNDIPMKLANEKKSFNIFKKIFNKK